jgi:hypothetical protein
MMTDADRTDLDAFVAEQDEARFTENAAIARSNRALRRVIAEKDKEIALLESRLKKHEHPSVAKIQAMLLREVSMSRDQIAERLSVDVEAVDAALQEMAERGYNVQDGIISRQGVATTSVVEHFYGDEVRFGIVSDTHLGNHHAMKEELHEAYEVFRREGIEQVYCPGNLLDGEKTYKGQEYEIEVMGVENVVNHLAHHWPEIPGIRTFHVASSTCHEGYYLKSAGILIGKLIEIARPDMPYLGLDEADIVLHDSPARPTLRIVHPGGGSSYAHSYRPQKIVESYSGGEKPTMLVIGHYHKAGFYDIRNVATWQAGCLERQTPFMRKRSLEAHLGFWIIEARFTEHGSLRRLRSEWFKYYVGTQGKILRDWAL